MSMTVWTVPLVVALSLSSIASTASADTLARTRAIVAGSFGPDGPMHGTANSATIRQSGGNNSVFLRQHGSGHSADITQMNGDNILVVVQLGRGSNVNAIQHGGESEIIVVFGR